MKIGKLRFVVVTCLVVAPVVCFVAARNALAIPLGCNVRCDCLEVLAYENIAQTGSGNGWKEITGGGDIPITWGEGYVWTRGGGCGSGPYLGTETVRYYDYDTVPVCDPSGLSGTVEAAAIGNGVATDLLTTRRICH